MDKENEIYYVLDTCSSLFRSEGHQWYMGCRGNTLKKKHLAIRKPEKRFRTCFNSRNSFYVSYDPTFSSVVSMTIENFVYIHYHLSFEIIFVIYMKVIMKQNQHIYQM